ncbi:MAG TPA: hypothetical protein PLP33_27755 [Leptospiraceae bacterium]|nr:hypothetical protein [Leptospiraceae bacterium]
MDKVKFKLTDTFVDKYKDLKAPFGFNGLGELVYQRTYSRIKEDGQNEKWYETVRRVVEGTYTMQKKWIEEHNLGWDARRAQRSAQEMFDRIFNMKFLPPGRGLWAMGSTVIEERGLNAALNNCAYVSTKNLKEDLTKPFTFLMDASMLGVGVGFDTRGAGSIMVKGPNENKGSWVFVIPDSREGWVESLHHLLESYFLGLPPVSFDYSEIREAGLPIKGFGGVSSGPAPLKEMHETLRTILNKNIGEPITITTIVDIMNLVGKAVVAGNVRRTAEIVFGEHDSDEYISLKDYTKNPDRETFGWTSNNSVFAEIGMDYKPTAEKIKLNGEPGYAWLSNMQNYSRMNNGPDFKDSRAEGGNPCLEQTLESYELCCLVETFPNNHADLEDYRRTLKYAYLYAKTVTLGKTHWPETNRVLLRNRRIGCSMSGIAQFIASRGVDTLRQWCQEGYDTIQNYDKSYSDWFAIPRSIKTTSVKPSGCQRSDTLINTEKGIFELSELAPSMNGEQWQDISYKTTDGKDITKFYINGKVDTKVISTKDGNQLECSTNHKYKVLEGSEIVWKTADNLKVGDSLLCSIGDYANKEDSPLVTVPEAYHNTRKIKQPSRMTPKLAWLLGLIYGDGSVHGKGIRVSFNRKEPSLVFNVKEAVKELFDIDIVIDSSTNLYINSTTLLDYLRANNMLKEFCEELTVPRAIRSSSRESILSFITGFWRADGGTHNQTTWTMCTVSKKFALQLLTIGRAVGLNLKIKNAGPGGFGYNGRFILSSRSISKDNLRYISAELRNRQFEGYWLDPIVSIEDSENYTYDISVPDGNTYIANGTVSHNTVSLLAGATPGIHYPENRFYIRRVRLGIHSQLIKPLEKAGYKIEPAYGSEDSTVVVEIPVDSGDGVRTVSEVSMWEQLSLAAFMQKYWADNQVSATVTFDPKTEGNQIPYALNFFQYQLKGVSFLPKLEKGAYRQMPYEGISEDTYKEMVRKLKPLNFNKIANEEAEIERFCNNDTCELPQKK